MPFLSDPVQAGDLQLANRVAMAPLTRNRSPNAVPTDLVATYYTQRASAGLIISEATAISQQGQGYADVPGLYAPEQVAAWKKVTSSVHAAGGKIVVQLWHVGRVSHTDLQPGNAAPVAPSAIQANTKTVLIQNGVPTFTPTSMPRALELAEIPGIVADYRRAARAAIEAGFDGVEIHAANGYLIDQFLKTGANQRTDAYGGSIENRARLLLEVTHAITEEIGGGRTGIRLSPVTPPTTSSMPTHNPCLTTWCASLGPWACRTSTSSKAPPAARARWKAARLTTPPSRPPTAQREARVRGWSTTPTPANWPTPPWPTAPTSWPLAAPSSPTLIWWRACTPTHRSTR